jgi:hypothetical protein
MNLEIKIRKTVPVKFLKIQAPVRYGDDDMPYDAPMRHGGQWFAIVDLATQTIVNWPTDQTLSFDMKVCDQGTYILFDTNLVEVARIDQDYVPNALLPGAYGDYLKLKIDANGKITNWLENANLSEFEQE